MNALRDRELRDRETNYRDERHDYREQRPAYREPAGDREISLGTGTILGIFFALALTCAVFFGFGYSIGRKSSVQPVAAISEPVASGGLFSSFKPSAGKPVGVTVSQKNDPANSVSQPGADAPEVDTDTQTAQAAPKQRASSTSTPAVKTLARVPNVQAPTAATSSAMPSTTPTGTAMVQVAAVSHQEDADLLLSALKKRGYEVFVRHEAQDRLLHVQVGPFGSKKDADVMRQRLLSDGYNAIVK